MSKLKTTDRCLITLVDKNGDKVESKIVEKSLSRFAHELKLKNNLDQGDKIIIESEEL